jgi:hypothetical protein
MSAVAKLAVFREVFPTLVQTVVHTSPIAFCTNYLVFHPAAVVDHAYGTVIGAISLREVFGNTQFLALRQSGVYFTTEISLVTVLNAATCARFMSAVT